ncbi:hypothetical protein AAG906_006886 [Vitis piasezkii]
MHLHIYCFLPLGAIPYEESIRHTCGPYSIPPRNLSRRVLRAPRDSRSSPPSTKCPRASSPIEGNSIADREHSMSRHILITLFCNKTELRIHTAYLRGTILYPL